jgi:flagellar motor switch protein FliN/FliY
MPAEAEAPAAEPVLGEAVIEVITAPTAQLAAEEVVSTSPIALDKVPVILVVEAGRLQMSAKELLDVQPGNMLELDMRPEQPVDLVINGARVGRGELVQVGEMVGVRVVQWGHG